MVDCGGPFDQAGSGVEFFGADVVEALRKIVEIRSRDKIVLNIQGSYSENCSDAPVDTI